MKRRNLTITHVLVTLLAMSSITLAQTAAKNKQDWESLKTLAYEDLLAVDLKNGTTAKGTLIGVEGNILKLYQTEYSRSSGITHENIINLERENILKVYRLDRKSGRKWTIIGAIAGAAAGAAVGIAIAGSVGNCDSRPSIFDDPFFGNAPSCGGTQKALLGSGMGAGGGLLGAFIGNRIGQNRLKRTLVYEAKAPGNKP